MPYFITDSAEGCNGWATIKDDGEVIGCHTNKQAAIDQMVAVSIAEGMEPGGERKEMTKVEIREMQVQDLEVREVGNGAVFSGYAAVFNSDSEPLPFVEQIRPGAFQRTLGSRNNVKMFVNHDDTMVLASTRSGTLRLSEDGRGLRAEADLPDTTYARDLSVLLRTGVVDSMSFGFSVPRGGDEWSQDGQRRFLNEIRLHEVSVVTGFPAYEATTAAIRKAQIGARRNYMEQMMLSDILAALKNGQDLNDQQLAYLIAMVEREHIEQIVDDMDDDKHEMSSDDAVTIDPSDADLIETLRQRLELAAKAV